MERKENFCIFGNFGYVYPQHTGAAGNEHPALPYQTYMIQEEILKEAFALPYGPYLGREKGTLVRLMGSALQVMILMILQIRMLATMMEVSAQLRIVRNLAREHTLVLM